MTLTTVIWALFDGAPGWQIFAGALVALAASLLIFQQVRGALKSVAQTAHLRLQVYGDARWPTLITQDNIFRWFLLRPQMNVLAPGGQVVQSEIAILFLTFENDTRIKTLEITSPDAVLPAHETKEYNQRYVIVTFDGSLPRCTLEVKAGY